MGKRNLKIVPLAIVLAHFNERVGRYTAQLISQFKTATPLLFLCVLTSLYHACASSNCYTARIVEKKQIVFSPGMDYLAIFNKEKITFSHEPPFLPALGMHYGLTNRVEIGLRGFFPYTVEALTRFQVTPRNFRLFDLSANLHLGTLKFYYPLYLKMGCALGRRIWQLEPVMGYYRYMSLSKDVKNSSALNFGCGIPWKTATLIPEINWHCAGRNIKNGVGIVSLGIRIPADKEKKAKP